MTEDHAAHSPASYAKAVSDFSLTKAEEVLAGSLTGGLNACVECCDHYAEPGRVALNWLAADGRQLSFTFLELQEQAARFANLLTELGIGPGETVAGMLPRTPELLVTILGTWRAGAVYQPLFTAFGPKAVEQRLQMSRARLVVTNMANRLKLDDVAASPKAAVVLGPDEQIPDGDIDFAAALYTQPVSFEPIMRKGSDLFLMMSTSGTTGAPKGVAVPLRALLSFAAYMREAVDLRPEDRFWNIADPGWAYGLYYAVTGPLLLGHATTFYEGPFTVESTYDVINRLGITNLAGAPTAYRRLIAAGPEAAAAVRDKLRVVSSAGEPLNPEVIRWFAEHLGAPIHDHYGQTEVGMVVNNHHGLDHPVRPGSSGVVMPGFRVVVLDDDGNELAPNTPGALAIDVNHSLLCWFTGYWHEERPAIVGGYYRTGDTVEFEPDGSMSFIGRSDDVITSAGYRIGPFDVESALIEHPAVTETAVVGVPDAERTELVKAFVVLAKGYAASEALANDLKAHVRARLSAHAYPRIVEFVSELPKTPSGKIQRFVLRRQEVEKQGMN